VRAKAKAKAKEKAKEKARAKVTAGAKVRAWVTPVTPFVVNSNGVVLTLGNTSGAENILLKRDAGRWQGKVRLNQNDNVVTLVGGSVTLGPHPAHVVLTADGSRVRLSVNGVQVTSAATGHGMAAWNDAFRLDIGNEDSGARPFAGVVHMVAVYADFFDRARIVAHFGQGPRRASLEGSDADLDGVPDDDDNCLDVPNVLQLDGDGDTFGDVCEP
jgi:hypothetical protein